MPWIARTIYSLLWWLVLPLALVRLWWRGRREPGYRRHLGERLGCYRSPTFSKAPLLWVHAVSVGETRAAQPLINALLEKYPQHRVLITGMTATGRATAHALFAHYGERFLQSYLPYDIHFFIKRFLRFYQPAVCVLIETEVWPNLVAQCTSHGIPVALVNARLSARSLARGQRLGSLIGSLITGAAQRLTCIAAQTSADAGRLQQMGGVAITVTGNLKFDVIPPASQLEQGQRWRAQFGERPVVLCASTRDGEEAAILAAAKLLAHSVLLIIVPRHPQRVQAVAELIASHGLSMVRRSQLNDDSLPPSTRVVLGDSMGEMVAYYAACDLTFVGGSLFPLGGQNLIEACAVGVPVLVGPYTFNFSVATEAAIAAGAAQRVDNAAALIAAIEALINDDAKRTSMRDAAQAFALQHRGATARTVALLAPLINQRL
jgi:3-deoxy-D-manno-octulosonic-acid transferase